MIIAIIGPCGCGKTAVGRELAHQLSRPFIDADDYHSTQNREKMTQKIPLTDEDRLPWLITLYKKLLHEPTAVLACSALKRKYRDTLSYGTKAEDPKNCILFVLLKVSRNLLQFRMEARQDHFMPIELIQSQLETLEEFDADERSLTLDAGEKVEKLVQQISELLVTCDSV